MTDTTQQQRPVDLIFTPNLSGKELNIIMQTIPEKLYDTFVDWWEITIKLPVPQEHQTINTHGNKIMEELFNRIMWFEWTNGQPFLNTTYAAITLMGLEPTEELKKTVLMNLVRAFALKAVGIAQNS